MCDPFFVFIVGYFLGKKYVVWDKTATIKFRKPGVGRMRAIFEISPQKLHEIKAEVDEAGKKTFWFEAEVHGPEGELVAQVEKEVYVRRK